VVKNDDDPARGSVLPLFGNNVIRFEKWRVLNELHVALASTFNKANLAVNA
jgi:hypothetical protein